MTREEAINYMKSSGISKEQIGTIVKALESENDCSDFISRKAALDKFEWYIEDEFINPGFIRAEDAIRMLKELPAVKLRIMEDKDGKG